MSAIDVLDKYAKFANQYPGQKKGMWVLWTQLSEYTGNVYIRIGRVDRKQGKLLITEQHERIYHIDAWLLPGNVPVGAHWPVYSWGVFESLLPSQAAEVLERMRKEQST